MFQTFEQNFQFFGYLLFLICDCWPANYFHHESIQSDNTKKVFRVRDLIFHSVLFPVGTVSVVRVTKTIFSSYYELIDC
jgi:hypothetical protein